MKTNDRIRVMFVGDINMGEYYTAFGHGPRTFTEHSDIFSDVKEILSQAHLVAGNLEAPITNHDYHPNRIESAVLRGNPNHAHQLADAGFKILQVANNHCVQHGVAGFQETVSIIQGLGISAIGLENQEPIKLAIGGQSLGFLASSDVPDNTDREQSCYQRLNEAFLTRVRAAVKNVDHLFVMFHWGLEASTTPMNYQIDIINEMAHLGVRGVIGQHPHLFYPVWRAGPHTIAAPSLGNFVFDLFWDKRLLKSAILDIELTHEGLSNCKVWPVELCRDSGRPIPSAPPINLGQEINLYNLGNDMNGEQSKKIRCFFKDYFKGNTVLKTKFITNKIIGKI